MNNIPGNSKKRTTSEGIRLVVQKPALNGKIDQLTKQIQIHDARNNHY